MVEQKQKMVEFFKAKYPEKWDLIDVNALYDSKLSGPENQRIITEEFNKLGISIEASIGRKKDDTNKQMVAFWEKEQLEKMEKEAENSFMKSLEEIENDKQSNIIEQIYFIPKSFAKMVARKNATGYLLVGECGGGKTYSVLRAFKEEGAEFVYSCGFTSTLELYNFLFENKDKNIIFDDVSNLLKSPINLDLLKSALYSPKGVRIVQYNSTSPRLKIPHRFEFTGTLTILLNKLGNNEDIRAMADRVLFYELKLDYNTKLKVIFELAKQSYKNITKEERFMITKWMKENTTKATRNLNLRLLYKLFNIYLFDKTNWERIAEGIIDDDEEMIELKRIIDRSSSVKSACEEFISEGYGSRATFFRLKRKLS